MLPQAPPGGLLTLDLSSVVGLAYGPDDLDRPLVTEQFLLPAIGGRGAKASAAEDLFDAIMEAYEPARLVTARPLPLPALNHYDAAFQQFGLAWSLCAAAYRASCATSSVDENTIRWAVLGKSQFKKGGAKVAALAFCREHGIAVRGHHAADAVLVWLWHRIQVVGYPSYLKRARFPLLEPVL